MCAKLNSFSRIGRAMDIVHVAGASLFAALVVVLQNSITESNRADVDYRKRRAVDDFVLHQYVR